MSDSRFALRNSCGCCDGTGPKAPVKIHNRSGLSAIAYRVGKHGEMLTSMLARLSSKDYPALAGLRTRVSDDFSIALLDGYSCIADVLSFYQERIANEAYLRTAGERFSLQELARLVGYRLNPGVAAETFFAFTMDDAAGGPERVSLETGLKVQSVPGQDEKPQTFETVEEIEARREWNEIRCQTTIPWEPLKGDRSLYLEGTSHQLQPGDVILIVGNHRLKNPGSERWDTRMVEKVDIDNNKNRTRISWQRGLGHTSPYTEPAATDVNVFVFRQQAALFGHNASDPHMLHSAGTGLSDIMDTSNHTWKKFNIEYGLESPAEQFDLDGAYKKIVPQSWLLLVSNEDFNTEALPGYLELYRAESVSYRSRTDYGLSTKITRVRPDTTEHLDHDHFSLRDTLVYGQSEILPTAAVPLNYPVYDKNLFLAGKIEGLTVKKPLAVSGKRARIEILGLEDETLTLKLNNCVERVLHRGDSLQLSGVPCKLTGAIAHSLSPVEFGESLTREPGDNLRLIVLDRDGSEGTLDVCSDQIQLLPAEEADVPVAEIVFIAEIPTVNPPRRDLTEVELADTLRHIYDRASVRINANVVRATHGETVHQLLGSGQARQSHQRFALQHAPLTFVSSENETGAETALEIRVNDIAWHERDTLYDADADDRSYIVRVGETGAAEVEFGDGIKGARLPTGQENIHGIYRKGIGSVGNLKAGQLNQLLSRPLGLRSATNPQPSSGGVDAEKKEDARRNIPLGVRTLDRAVSLQDYEDYARAYTGIAKAHAEVLQLRDIRTILITVAGEKGGQPQPGDTLLQKLKSSLIKNSDPFVACEIVPYEPAYFRLALRIRRHPDHNIDTVKTDVEATLRRTFSFTGSNFGQLVARSQIIHVVQQVQGVIGVDVDYFYRGSTAGLEDRLIPETAFESSYGRVTGAELLFLDPGPLDDLKEML